MPFTQPPTPPTLADPSNFNLRAEAWLAWQLVFAAELDAMTPGESAAGLAQSLFNTSDITKGASLVRYRQAIINGEARTLRAKTLESISLLDITGVVGDGALTALAGTGTGTNNVVAVQAAFNAIVASGKPRRVVVPNGLVFRMDDTLVVDCSFIVLDFQGGALDFTNIGAKPAIHICASGANPYSAQSFWAIGNGKIQGPNYSVAGSIGLYYESNVGGIGNTDVAATGAMGLNVWGFETSIKIGNNAYSNIHLGCKFWFSKEFFMAPAGLTNAGVKWSFPDCQFLNGQNGFTSYEPTINVELMNCIIVTTDGYTFRPEAGYFTMLGGSVEVDATGGAQFIYNNNAGGGAKNSVTTLGVNLLFKTQVSKSAIELNSTNSYVTMVGGHASIADAAAPGTVPMIKGSGSGAVVLENVIPDGALNPVSSLSLGAGFTYKITDPFTGQVYSNMRALYAGISSRVPAGGSIFAFSGDEANSVLISATPTVLVADDAHHFIFAVRDTSGGIAVGVYEGANTVQIILSTLSNISFTRTTSGLKAATTGGAATRTLKVLAIRI